MGKHNMDSETTHSFIVKVWLEETADEAGTAIWRGHITNVPSGERRYINNLEDIPTFIAPYLEALGVELPKRWGLRRWFRRLLRRIGRS